MQRECGLFQVVEDAFESRSVHGHGAVGLRFQPAETVIVRLGSGGAERLKRHVAFVLL